MDRSYLWIIGRPTAWLLVVLCSAFVQAEHRVALLIDNTDHGKQPGSGEWEALADALGADG